MKQRFEKEMSKLERELERERTTAHMMLLASLYASEHEDAESCIAFCADLSLQLEAMENRLRDMTETLETIEVEYKNALPYDPEREGKRTETQAKGVERTSKED